MLNKTLNILRGGIAISSVVLSRATARKSWRLNFSGIHFISYLETLIKIGQEVAIRLIQRNASLTDKDRTDE